MRTNCEHPILLVRPDALNHVHPNTCVSIKTTCKHNSKVEYFMRKVKSDVPSSLSARLLFGEYRTLIESKEEIDVKYWHEVVEYIADTTFISTDSGYIPLYFIAPCGYCSLCKNAKVSDWKQRIFLESQAYSLPPLFVTLTYDNDHNDGELHKPHIVDFIKRLRKNLEDSSKKDNIPFDRKHLYLLQQEKHYFNDETIITNDSDLKTSIRYFLAGEYGSHTKRPHYHCLIWNYPIVRDKNDCIDRIATLKRMEQFIVDSWGHGDFGKLYLSSDGKHGKNLDIQYAKNAGAYVCKYMLKSDADYPDKITKPFTSKSLGLGYRFPTPQLREMADKFVVNDNLSSLSVMDKHGVTPVKVYAYKSFANRFINLSLSDIETRKTIEKVLFTLCNRIKWLDDFVVRAEKFSVQCVSAAQLRDAKHQVRVMIAWRDRIYTRFQPIYENLYHFTTQVDNVSSVTWFEAMQSMEDYFVDSPHEFVAEMCFNDVLFDTAMKRTIIKNRKVGNALNNTNIDIESKIKDLKQRQLISQSKELF